MNYSFLVSNGFLALGILTICSLVIICYIYAKNRLHKETITDGQLKSILIIAIVFVAYYTLIYDPKPKLVQNMFLTVANVSSMNYSAIPKGFYLVLVVVLLLVFYFAHKKSIANKAVVTK